MGSNFKESLQDCKRGRKVVAQEYPDELPTDYTFTMTVEEETLGLHEFSFYVINADGKQTNYKNFPLYVVDEDVPDDYTDKEGVKYNQEGEFACPPSGSTIEPNRKFQFKAEDENGVFFFAHLWTEGTEPVRYL